MFVRLLLPFMAIILFFSESIFSLFSPVTFGDVSYFLVPRFIFMYVLFLAVYYDRNKSVMYAAIFGLLFDVIFIDIIGLFTVLYPLFCLFINWIVKFIQQTLPIVTILTAFLVALLELIVYEFFKITSITAMSFEDFLVTRMGPTIVANLFILILLGWLFKYLIKTRKLLSV